MSIKKVLVSGAALLMLSTSAGAVVSNQSNVHAASRTTKIANLNRRKAKDYADIKSINAQLNKLQPRKHKRVSFFFNKKVSRNKKSKAVHHESLATWYTNNGKRLYHHYINTNNNFRKGWHNGNDYTLNTDYTGNKYYRNGWIDGAAYNANDNNYGTRTNYRHVLNIYKQGLIYAKNNNANHIWYDSMNSAWNVPN